MVKKTRFEIEANQGILQAMLTVYLSAPQELPRTAKRQLNALFCAFGREVTRDEINAWNQARK